MHKNYAILAYIFCQLVTSRCLPTLHTYTAEVVVVAGAVVVVVVVTAAVGAKLKPRPPL